MAKHVVIFALKVPVDTISGEQVAEEARRLLLATSKKKIVKALYLMEIVPTGMRGTPREEFFEDEGKNIPDPTDPDLQSSEDFDLDYHKGII